MAKHEWSEESWEGTASSGYRHCLVCKVFKTVQNQNEDCPGVQLQPPAIQAVPADAPEGFIKRYLTTPEGKRALSRAGCRPIMEARAKQRLEAAARMCYPPQQVPDEVLDRYRKEQELRTLGVSMLEHSLTRAECSFAKPLQSVPIDELLVYRMQQFVQDALSLGVKGVQIQDMFWKAYTQAAGLDEKTLSPDEVTAAWAREEKS